MDLLTVLILALGLSMDSFAVSVGCGLSEQKISFFNAVRISFFLAFFQGLLPILGWIMGSEIKDYVHTIDHWIAFSLLLFLGSKMALRSFHSRNSNPNEVIYSWNHILTLSLATSIDALVVGFSYALASAGNILIGAVIIALVTFVLAMLGIRIGKDLGRTIGPKIELLGGVILIGIGIRILLQHLGTVV